MGKINDDCDLKTKFEDLEFEFNDYLNSFEEEIVKLADGKINAKNRKRLLAQFQSAHYLISHLKDDLLGKKNTNDSW